MDVLHSDANSYYASVEMMLDSSLRGKPVAVCGSTETRHGIVLAKSQLAKKAGVKTGMANWEARRCCPDLIIVPPQYTAYIKYSRLLHDIYCRYTNLVEPFGMDECWLDVTGSYRFGCPLAIAEEIRAATKEELGLSVSVGVSFNKAFAKLGSDMKKPDAITFISQENFREKVWPLPAGDLLWVGSATERKLALRGVYTIGDIAKCEPYFLKSLLGVNGLRLLNLAAGKDASRVAPFGYSTPIKSVGHGITCTADLYANEEVKSVLLSLAPRVSFQLRQANLQATGVQMYVRDNSLYGMEFQSKLSHPTQSWRELVGTAMELFMQRYTWPRPVRAVCIRAINLIPFQPAYQLDFFADHVQRQKIERLERAVDDIHRRFGDDSVFIASTANAKMKKDKTREMLIMPGAMYV